MIKLTEREQIVWDKRNAGLTFKQIAEDLGLCVQTVSFAYRKAYRKIEYEKERFVNTADSERLRVIAELEEWVDKNLRRLIKRGYFLPNNLRGLRLVEYEGLKQKLNEIKGE